jgi:hypothetical protein
VAGLTIAELVRSTGRPRDVLEEVLKQEIACGRVVVEDGLFSLRPGALPPAVAEGMRELTRPDVAPARSRDRRRPEGGRVHASERANLNFAVS